MLAARKENKPPLEKKATTTTKKAGVTGPAVGAAKGKVKANPLLVEYDALEYIAPLSDDSARPASVQSHSIVAEEEDR